MILRSGKNLFICFLLIASAAPGCAAGEGSRNSDSGTIPAPDREYPAEAAAGEVPVPDETPHDYAIMDSGGELLPEQAAYRVHFYDLNFGVNPADSTLSGNAATYAEIQHPADELVLDFDTTFTIDQLFVLRDEEYLPHATYRNRGGQLWIRPGKTLQPGDRIELRVHYEGRPRVAENPPWDGGFVWDYTDDGTPWIGVTCQMDGANIWWPGKDHPSDRADSVAISVTVPDDLVAVSNGRAEGVRREANGLKTYDWFVSTPINDYAVSINIGPYTEIERSYEGRDGYEMPLYFWALPEHADNARELIPQIKDQLRHYEEVLGPYPFRADKYGVVETPYFGMEHQTLIAYGAGYEDDTTFDTGSGFDDLHHHELAHEWWGNLVSAADWKDFWIHEGFGTYMSPLYVEDRQGSGPYHHFMNTIRSLIDNEQPVAVRGTASAQQVYIGRDMYYKAAWMLHTLRYLIGDEAMRESLRRMAYPDPESEATTDGSAARFASADDYINLIADITGEDYSWFFDMYLYRAELPELIREHREGRLHLHWETPANLPFEVPVELHIDGAKEVKVIGTEPVSVAEDDRKVEVDPDNWILREGQPGS